jgi:hypothetical protein
LLSACDSSKHNDSSSIENRYSRQKLPNLIPDFFAPQILYLDENNETDMFSPHMKEFYFSCKYEKYNKKHSFFVIRFEINNWGEVSETDIRWSLSSTERDTMYDGKEYSKRTNDSWPEYKSLGKFLEE